MSRDAAHHVHESPAVMTLPLVVLALLTFFAGWVVGLPSAHGTRFERFLAPVFPAHADSGSGMLTLALGVVSVIAAGAGVITAWTRYLASPVRAETIGQPRSALHALLINAYYVDQVYDRAVVRPLQALSVWLARAFDLGVIDGAVNGIGRAVVALAARGRRLQTGYVVNYALTMLVGAVVVVGFLLTR
jgi:NADH-quinone oxidoreductase subunit L